MWATSHTVKKGQKYASLCLQSIFCLLKTETWCFGGKDTWLSLWQSALRPRTVQQCNSAPWCRKVPPQALKERTSWRLLIYTEKSLFFHMNRAEKQKMITSSQHVTSKNLQSAFFLSQRSQTFILKYPLVGWLNVFNAPHPCTLLSMCETETGIRWAPLIFHTTCYFTLKKTTTICGEETWSPVSRLWLAMVENAT